MQTSFGANMLALVASDTGLGFVIWLVARRRIAAVMSYYFPPTGACILSLAALNGVALSLVLNGGNELLSRAKLIEFSDTDVERALVPHGAMQFLVSVTVVSLLAPFVEEFFFRGLLVTWLRQKHGLWFAMSVSGALFAAAHGQMFVHPNAQGWLYTGELLLAGVILAQWTVRTGTLRTSLAVHAAYNLTATLFSVLLT
jgi:membrane protease YdiL (CAAX protease family)